VKAVVFFFVINNVLSKGEKMEKEKSLKFLQDCIDNVDKATKDEIKKFKKLYKKHCNLENNNELNKIKS
jgi:hypothetical protein